MINITGSENTPLDEIEEAIALVHDEADEEANIIFGTVYSESTEAEVKITVIATGFEHSIASNKIHEEKLVDTKAAQNYIMRPATKPSELGKEEDLDIPTFIRRQAD